jgi:hypothetical protein
MRSVMPVLVLSWLMLGGAFDRQVDAMGDTQGGKEGEVSLAPRQGGVATGPAPMRIEEPDGTIQALPLDPLPKGRMSTEGLQEVPDAGGGTMVNVEGRFQSILQVPEGSDQAVHGHDSEAPPQSKP